jgi:hypothetical protein
MKTKKTTKKKLVKNLKQDPLKLLQYANDDVKYLLERLKGIEESHYQLTVKIIKAEKDRDKAHVECEACNEQLIVLMDLLDRLDASRLFHFLFKSQAKNYRAFLMQKFPVEPDYETTTETITYNKDQIG